MSQSLIPDGSKGHMLSNPAELNCPTLLSRNSLLKNRDSHGSVEIHPWLTTLLEVSSAAICWCTFWLTNSVKLDNPISNNHPTSKSCMIDVAGCGQIHLVRESHKKKKNIKKQNLESGSNNSSSRRQWGFVKQFFWSGVVMQSAPQRGKMVRKSAKKGNFRCETFDSLLQAIFGGFLWNRKIQI